MISFLNFLGSDRKLKNSLAPLKQKYDHELKRADGQLSSSQGSSQGSSQAAKIFYRFISLIAGDWMPGVRTGHSLFLALKVLFVV